MYGNHPGCIRRYIFIFTRLFSYAVFLLFVDNNTYRLKLNESVD